MSVMNQKPLQSINKESMSSGKLGHKGFVLQNDITEKLYRAECNLSNIEFLQSLY